MEEKVICGWCGETVLVMSGEVLRGNERLCGECIASFGKVTAEIGAAGVAGFDLLVALQEGLGRYKNGGKEAQQVVSELLGLKFYSPQIGELELRKVAAMAPLMSADAKEKEGKWPYWLTLREMYRHVQDANYNAMLVQDAMLGFGTKRALKEKRAKPESLTQK